MKNHLVSIFLFCKDISKQLRAIFDLIIQFQSNLDNLYKCSNLEKENQFQYEQIRKEKTKQVNS